MSVNIREIQPEDNQAIARVIRAAFEEFNAPLEGTVYSDSATDNLYELFKLPGSAYYVVLEEGILLGGCGIFPTPGLPEGCAEMVKFYLSHTARGKGLGKTLMNKCFQAALALGYHKLYLESFPELSKAISIYEKNGFHPLDHPMGNSGHHGCSIWMLKEL